MIELRGVGVSRGGRQVLSGLDLRLSERRVGVIGANGSGKSTFARLINGLVLPSEGAVFVEGVDVRADVKAARRLVGFLFQNPDNQIVYPTVAEDVAFGLGKRGLDKTKVAARVAEALRRHALGGFENRLIHELSGGERQLVALAGVLVMSPRILVLDEPTTLLDRRNTRRLMAAVEETDAQVILVTHDLSLLRSFDRVLVFEDGRIVCDDRPAAAVAAYEERTVSEGGTG